MLTDKEKTKRKNQKKLKSFRNKMGINIVWFDSLTKQKQYDLLFEWEQEKYEKKLVIKPIKKRKRILVKKGYRYSPVWSDVIIYPANLKHFIRESKPRYKAEVSRVRETTIDFLLKNI
jgi:hypothetical protein